MRDFAARAAACGRNRRSTTQLRRCLRQEQPRRSWGRRQNLQAGGDPRSKFGERQPKGAAVCFFVSGFSPHSKNRAPQPCHRERQRTVAEGKAQGRQERKARRRVDPNAITTRYEVSLPCQRSLPEPRLHVSNDSNEITVPRIPTKPTVATISTIATKATIARFPRSQRLPRNARKAFSCKPLPTVESWKRWNRGTTLRQICTVRRFSPPA